MKEVLIGFDVRNIADASTKDWTDWHRTTFLLDESKAMALTVDTMIWPSIIGKLKLEQPEKYGHVRHIWYELDKLREFIKSAEVIPQAGYWELAYSQFYDEGSDEISRTGFLVNPPTLQDNWIFLGYEVAEEVLLSGLNNMGYSDDEKPYAVKEFAHALNQYNLFDDYEIAHKFALWSNTRDPGHGPFFVTGLYRIPPNAQ